MSAKASGIVWESDLPRPEKYVLLALADHAKEDGSDVYPSLSRIEWKTGYSETQVRDIMNSLREKRVLVLVHEGGRGPEDTHEYKIDFKALKPLPDFRDWKGAKTEPIRVRKPNPSKGTVSPEKGCGLPLNKGAKTEPEPTTTRTNTVIEPTTFCAETSSAPPATVITLPLNDGTKHKVTSADVAAWHDLYPAVDVMQQLRHMYGWLDSHPRNRKTKSGIRAFCTAWLSRQQNRSPGVYANGAPNSRLTEQQSAAETELAVAAGVDKFLRGKNEMGGKHVPATTPAKPGEPG